MDLWGRGEGCAIVTQDRRARKHAHPRPTRFRARRANFPGADAFEREVMAAHAALHVAERDGPV